MSPTVVAALPMYDWPEARAAVDALWAAVRDAYRARGLPAPEALCRDDPHWTDPRLALGQTCARPWRARLHDRTTLLGALDFGLPGCPPGFYNSALVVRADDPRDDPAAFDRLAWNSTDSQSGHGALSESAGPLDPSRGIETGAHRDSIRAVAAGAADLAAIDAVSWRLATAWEPAAARLRVIGWTRPTPGLPLICAAGLDPAPRIAALAEAVAALPAAARAPHGLRAFVPLAARAYMEG